MVFCILVETTLPTFSFRRALPAPVLLCCRRHLPAPFFSALLLVLFFALALAVTGFAAFFTVFTAFLALFFSSPAGRVETSSCVAPRMPSSRSRDHRLDLCDLLAQLAELLHSVVLPQRDLKAKPEQLLGRRLLLVQQLVVAQITNLCEFHLFSPALRHSLWDQRARLPYADYSAYAVFFSAATAFSAPGRSTNLVFSGSLFDASRIASCAISGVTPSISNRILPGRTTATQ